MTNLRKQLSTGGNRGSFNKSLLKLIGLEAAALLDELIYLDDLFINQLKKPSIKNNKKGFIRTFLQLSDATGISTRTIERHKSSGALFNLIALNLVSIVTVKNPTNKKLSVTRFELDHAAILKLVKKSNIEYKKEIQERKKQVRNRQNGIGTNRQNGSSLSIKEPPKVYPSNNITKYSNNLRAVNTNTACEVTPISPIKKETKTRLGYSPKVMAKMEYIDTQFSTLLDNTLVAAIDNPSGINLRKLYNAFSTAVEFPHSYKASNDDIELLKRIVSNENGAKVSMGDIYARLLPDLAKVACSKTKRFGNITFGTISYIESEEVT